MATIKKQTQSDKKRALVIEYIAVTRKLKRSPTAVEFFKLTDYTKSTVVSHYLGSYTEMQKEVHKKFAKDLTGCQLSEEISDDDIFDDYIAMCSKKERMLDATEFYAESGYTRAFIREKFVNFSGMIEKLVVERKTELDGFFTPLDFSQERHEEFVTKMRTSKKDSILAFTAVPGAKVHENFLNTLLSIAKKNNAHVLCLTTRGDRLLLDKRLKHKDIHVLTDELAANSNLLFRPVEAGATTVNLAKGFSKNTAATGGAIVVPSPKQVMHLAPNMDKLPRGTFSTGCVTRADYNRTASGYKARDGHFYGAYLFKIIDDRIFFPYNLDSLPDKAVVHLGVLYKPDGTTRKLSKEEIIRVDGDDHMMIRSKRVENVLRQVQKDIPAHAKVSHDTWDMHNCNHHELNDMIARAKKADIGNDKIEAERLVTRDKLKEEANTFVKIYCVDSNHNDALARYNKRGGYLEDSANWGIGHRLALAQMAGVDPVEFAVNHLDSFNKMLQTYFDMVKCGEIKDVKINTKPYLGNVHFLKKGETLTFGGYKLNYHGSEGAGGSRGTPDGMRVIHNGEVASYEEGIITGHTHTSGKHNRSINVGTSTELPHEPGAPGYAKNTPNAWMNSFSFVYEPREYNPKGSKKPVGSAQLLLIFDELYK